jgi:hypothetical protein
VIKWKSPVTAQDSLPAAGPALPGGIGYPQGSDEGFHIADSPFPSFLAQGQTELLAPVLQRVTSDSFNFVLANEANSGIELEFANLKDWPARAELLASPKPQCRCEGQEREGRDQGDVVD